MTLTPKSDEDSTKEKMINHVTYKYQCKILNKIQKIKSILHQKNNMPWLSGVYFRSAKLFKDMKSCSITE